MNFDLWQDTVQMVMRGAKGGFNAIWQLLDRLGAFINTFIFLFLVYTVFRLMIAPLVGATVNITRSDYALKIVDPERWERKHNPKTPEFNFWFPDEHWYSGSNKGGRG